ncbi:MAG: hypothetical protein ACXWD8_17500 [Mycobacterium sp.]
MFKRVKGSSSETDAQLGVNTRVRVYPGTDTESRGVVVEDFGEMTAQPVDVGGHHFADPARRWAVLLDTGNLVFADTDQLVAE